MTGTTTEKVKEFGVKHLELLKCNEWNKILFIDSRMYFSSKALAGKYETISLILDATPHA